MLSAPARTTVWGIFAVTVLSLLMSGGSASRAALVAGDTRLDHVTLEATEIRHRFNEPDQTEFVFSCAPVTGTGFQFPARGSVRGPSFGEGEFGGRPLTVVVGEPDRAGEFVNLFEGSITGPGPAPIAWSGILAVPFQPACSISEGILTLTLVGLGTFAFSSSDGHSAGVPVYIDAEFKITADGALVSGRFKGQSLSLRDPKLLTLSPASDDSVGLSHTLTATPVDFCDSQPSVACGGAPETPIVFAVVGSANVSGQCLVPAVVGASCTFTYAAPASLGLDQITAFADANGNGIRDPWEPQAMATKSWGDVAPPTISAPPNVDTLTAPGACSAAPALGTATASDNSGTASVTNNAPASFAKGITVVTWTATDPSGNTATATQTVTVNDTELPVVSAPSNKSVLAASASGTVIATPDLGSALVSDNCPGVVVSVTGLPTGNLFPIGTTTLTWTATDASGNSSSATETVTVSYRICSLYDPTKPVKLGSTIPIRVQLCANDGTNLSSALLVLHAVTVVKQSDTTGDAPIDSGNANPDNDFRYDATLGVTGGYIYNLSTSTLSTGSWRLTFSAAGQLYIVMFQVK